MVVRCTQVKSSVENQLAAIEIALTSNGQLPAEVTLFSDPVEGLVQINLSHIEVAQAPAPQPDGAQPAAAAGATANAAPAPAAAPARADAAPAAAAPDAMEAAPAADAARDAAASAPQAAAPQSAAEAPVETYLLTFLGVRERRPYGALPAGVFSAEHVLAVLPELHNDPEVAAALQEAAQEEVDTERKQVRFASECQVRHHLCSSRRACRLVVQLWLAQVPVLQAASCS